MGDKPVDWSMFTPDRMELIFLGLLYRTRHSEGYRRHPDERVKHVDHVTGAPDSEAKLLPIGHPNWVSGAELALSSPLYPYKLAIGCLGLYWKPRTLALTAEQEREQEALLSENPLAENLPVPASGWTRHEIMSHAEMELRWKRALLAFSMKGPPWVLIRPPVAYTSEDGETNRSNDFKSGFGKDGLPRVAQATIAALDEAEQKIPTTKYAKGAKSALAVAPDDVRAHAAAHVPWALRHAQDEVAGQ